MLELVFEGQPWRMEPHNSLLESLLAAGIEVPFGCCSGACRSCLLRCLAGSIPPEAQRGLQDSQIRAGLFLACQCPPLDHLVLARPGQFLKKHLSEVLALERLSPSIIAVHLERPAGFDYRAGQFLKLFHPQSGHRSYSLASVPELDAELILNVRKIPDGHLSSWIHQDLRVGERVTITEALGECCYTEGQPDQPLLLIGTGSGLAPLIGIVRDALRRGHQGPMDLYHGGRRSEDLYLVRTLRALETVHPQFHYHPCLSAESNNSDGGIESGRASDLALAAHPSLEAHQVFLCGQPDMVRQTQVQAFLKGASLSAIKADPFEAQSN